MNCLTIIWRLSDVQKNVNVILPETEVRKFTGNYSQVIKPVIKLLL